MTTVSSFQTTLVGLTPQVPTSNIVSLDGILAVASGGTGATTAIGAALHILPIQAGHAGQFLATNGANTYWAAASSATGSGTVTSVTGSGGATGLTLTGTITTSGALTLGGILAISAGGTGAVTASSAINALVPSQTGQAGRFLTTDGSAVAWAQVANSGTVTSVNMTGGTTGLNFSGVPITTAGTAVLNGVLNIASGGTGGTTRAVSLNNLLPAQAGQTGLFLMTDGINAVWAAGSGGGGGGVSSVAMTSNLSGVTVGGSPITSSGTLTLNGTLGLASGGTGQTNAAAAANALLPSQTGQSGKFLQTNGNGVLSWAAAGGSGSGTVTSVSIVPANGFAGSIANATTTPAITLSTSIVGLIKGNGTALQAALAGTDYLGPTTGAAIQASNGTGGLIGITVSAPLAFSANTLSLTTVPITSGGTGQVTAAAAANALLPTQSVGVANYFLKTNGAGVLSWAAGGSVTSVAASGGTTGLTFTGSPITSAGTLTLSGTLAIASGGTGATTATAALTALLPSQTGFNTYVLGTDGTVASWVPQTSGGTPGGTTGQIQYNNAGAFGGFDVSGDATLNTSTGVITVTESTNIRGGLALEIPLQSAVDTTTFIPAPAVTGDVLTYDGATIAWATPTPPATIVPDTTTASPVYPVFVETTSGSLTTVNINDVSLQYTPSTGLFASSVFQATEGFFQNPNAIPASYTVPASTNQMSVGPVEIPTSVVITVPPSGIWKVI